MKQLKDNIDFGKDNVRMLFNRLFYPTLFGMVFSMVLNVTDGIFVGRGIGSLALPGFRDAHDAGHSHPARDGQAGTIVRAARGGSGARRGMS